MQDINTIRAVALFEAAKGVLVLIAGFGSLALVHEDAQALAEQLVGHLHLNPAKHYPRIFLDAAAGLTQTRLWTLAALAMAYATVRFVEAYGLWRVQRWAEWFAAVSAGVYIPFELYELYETLAWLSLGVLLVNLLIVGVMLRALFSAAPKGVAK